MPEATKTKSTVYRMWVHSDAEGTRPCIDHRDGGTFEFTDKADAFKQAEAATQRGRQFGSSYGIQEVKTTVRVGPVAWVEGDPTAREFGGSV